MKIRLTSLIYCTLLFLTGSILIASFSLSIYSTVKVNWFDSCIFNPVLYRNITAEQINLFPIVHHNFRSYKTLKEMDDCERHYTRALDLHPSLTSQRRQLNFVFEQGSGIMGTGIMPSGPRLEWTMPGTALLQTAFGSPTPLVTKTLNNNPDPKLKNLTEECFINAPLFKDYIKVTGGCIPRKLLLQNIENAPDCLVFYPHLHQSNLCWDLDISCINEHKLLIAKFKLESDYDYTDTCVPSQFRGSTLLITCPSLVCPPSAPPPPLLPPPPSPPTPPPYPIVESGNCHSVRDEEGETYNLRESCNNCIQTWCNMWGWYSEIIGRCKAYGFKCTFAPVFDRYGP